MAYLERKSSMKLTCIIPHSLVFALVDLYLHSLGFALSHITAGNRIGDKGAIALAKALKMNQSLQDLDLHCMEE